MDIATAESPAERRRQQQREEVRRAILDATEALLLEGGYDAFSMRRLAKRCGYTAPSIYHHFGDKQGLFDAVIDERVRRLLVRLRRVPRSDDALSDLLALAEAFAQFGLQNPTHYRLLTAPGPDSAPPSRAGEEVRSLFDGPINAVFDGQLGDDDHEEVRQCLWVLIHGVISMQTARPDEGWSDSLLRTALEAMLRGLAIRVEQKSGRSMSRRVAS